MTATETRVKRLRFVLPSEVSSPVRSRQSAESSIPLADLPRSRVRDKVEAVEIHHLVPRGGEVAHELLLRVGAGVRFRDGSELRVRTEDEVHGGASNYNRRDPTPET